MWNLRRSDIYLVSVPREHTVGSEQADVRPWVVLSAPHLHKFPVFVGVPLSTQVHKEAKYRHARIQIPLTSVDTSCVAAGCTPVDQDSLALTEQLRVLSTARILKGPLGRLVPSALHGVEAGVRYVLDL